MEWWHALLLGIVQGLTEFLPVSSSGHLMIVRELLGVDAEGFLDFTVTVHFATVLSTIVVFWKVICRLLKGLFQFRYNDETDYVFKIAVSMIPVGIVGLFFKDKVEALFCDSLLTVAVCLMVTAVMLFISDNVGGRKPASGAAAASGHRNGISYWQALVVGIGQACAVAPGLSRSGTTIATGLVCGVKREIMAQFSFLMVLVPIIGEQFLGVVKSVSAGEAIMGGLSVPCLVFGFLGAFAAGLFACKVMIEIVKKAKLTWFALYCLLAALLLIIFFSMAERTLTYFVSDVHLGLDVKNPAERERRFVNFLQSIPKEQTESLFLLGDIWDFWYEYRDVVPKGYVRVFSALMDLMDAGVKVFFFQGNHDIWCYWYFEEIGIRILQQPYFLEIGGKTFCLGHGDGLGPGNKWYKLMRWGFRKPFFQRLFSLLHPWLAFRFGENWSKHSRLAKDLPYVFKGESEPLYIYSLNCSEERHVDFFIFGHFHSHVDLTLPTGARLLVLKDWMDAGKEDYFVFNSADGTVGCFGISKNME